ncbi:hypothetical protein K0M31_010396 [Melipona bicolor]|uniref:Uncharacterized protein n=1 Tax=Melipona bicolor TaxID=60889 RepID=A0AA40FMF8_9HYME|nr:hypothetical protein K0M31_010396 [Melipona bicolor]
MNEEQNETLPESDICTFATRTEHFHIVNKPSTELFTSDTRPKALRELYEDAAIVAVRSLDSLRRDGSSMDMFLCTPVLGKRRRDQSLDIESRIGWVHNPIGVATFAQASSMGDVMGSHGRYTESLHGGPCREHEPLYNDTYRSLALSFR